MPDPRLEKLADLLVHYSVKVRPRDKVVIQGEAIAAPLLSAVYARVLQVGGYPIVLPELPEIDELFYRHASGEQLQYVSEIDRLVRERHDVLIQIDGASNTKALSNVDPKKISLRAQARAVLSTILMQRTAAGELRWVYTIFPTHAYAQDAEMSLREFEDFFYQACMPDLHDPVGYWQRVAVQQDRIVKWLSGKQRVHVEAPGTDLRLSIAGRPFINCAGNFNLPDGEVFTAPVEDSVEGQVYFSYPAIYGGKEVAGVRLWFEQGKVVRASAEKNEEFLLATLDTDEGARRAGEFAIATNEGITRFTRQILFDEKIGGSFHLALGASYPESGGVNQSAIHWDMICDLRAGGEIWVDEQLLYKEGKFVMAA
ncbi:aminopeptidase [candidate division KSB1 bacterium]|nr:MAG: aminopeptidase [candidate division KSB1 bacterium]MCE7942006.1 aminopeptidase [Chlorobi bacterium CHB1]MDL1879213.1 aminopeptidase [Cytophagia bacterium CHB2]